MKKRFFFYIVALGGLQLIIIVLTISYMKNYKFFLTPTLESKQEDWLFFSEKY